MTSSYVRDQPDGIMYGSMVLGTTRDSYRPCSLASMGQSLRNGPPAPSHSPSRRSCAGPPHWRWHRNSPRRPGEPLPVRRPETRQPDADGPYVDAQPLARPVGPPWESRGPSGPLIPEDRREIRVNADRQIDVADATSSCPGFDLAKPRFKQALILSHRGKAPGCVDSGTVIECLSRSHTSDAGSRLRLDARGLGQVQMRTGFDQWIWSIRSFGHSSVRTDTTSPLPTPDQQEVGNQGRTIRFR